ncbi:dihydroxyacetone kinase subunit DhaK [Glaciihabitans sp. UYNi722]|uniref:dihydroxyacetone kinase subunit DhaK n=1 Tax=Glaciihabitans sp. UYNi722 TaxID=3156344 RepID=UPI003396EF90
MQKIINNPESFVDEVLDGILLAHPNSLKSVSSDNRAVVRADYPIDSRVGIVTGGGSGHLPLFLGYVGKGLASGVAVGNVFSSPSSEQILAATKGVSGGVGVLYLYGNYGGDVFNFDLAADEAELEGIEVLTVIGTDDVQSAPAERSKDRRGVAGIFFLYKIAGAAAERGDGLSEVARIAAKANDRVRTMGVALSPTILPAAGKPTFTLDEGEMEIGTGLHGERGVHKGPLESADAITDRLIQAILADLKCAPGSRVAVLVNGLGATPLEELYVMYRHAAKLLKDQDITVHRAYVGEYATSLEMAGASISIFELDDELEALLDADAASPFFEQHGV